MESLKKPFSIKVIYWITIVTFWFYIAVTVFATFFVAVLLFVGLDGLQLHVGLPVLLDIKEQGTLDLIMVNKFIDVEMVEMSGKIHFINTPVEVGRVYAIFMFAVVMLFLYIFLIIKRFITNVYNGIYFDMKNINLLKRISYGLVIVWVFTATYGYFQYFFLVNNLEFNSIEFSASVQTYPIILLFALFIWVLSHIFIKGVELQEENQLTV